MTVDLAELLSLHKEYVPHDERLQPLPDAPDIGVATRLMDASERERVTF
jgi:hypothetical protein